MRCTLLIILVNEVGEACEFTDGFHTAHVDSKGHSVLLMTMDRGAIMSMLTKLGASTTISIETEVAANREHPSEV